MHINPIDQARDDALAQRGLPPIAYADNSDRRYDSAAPVIALKRGEPGYYPVHGRLTAEELNALEGVTPAQREAMLTGSMFGWHLKGADPKFHEELAKRARAQQGGGQCRKAVTDTWQQVSMAALHKAGYEAHWQGENLIVRDPVHRSEGGQLVVCGFVERTLNCGNAVTKFLYDRS